MNPNYIPGIYNYCDRWCERCHFTSRCRSFERIDKSTPGQTDIQNKAFWDSFGDSMKEAFDMLHAMAAEHGIDLNAIPAEELAAHEIQSKRVDKLVKAHPLIKLAKAYQAIAEPFLSKTFSQEMDEAVKEHTTHVGLGVENEQTAIGHLSVLNDCAEVLRWYLFFIHVKLERALNGKIEFEGDDDFLYDSNGSAKVALVSIERCMAAWVKLLELMPGTEDTALKALALLGRMRSATEKEFPGGVDFKRPGFDG